jgi:hypothetical protein
MNSTINLEDYRVKDSQKNIISKVFTGRDRGAYVRDESKIDEIEANNDRINIIIPNNIYSINPSFFEELFDHVVLKLGKEKFLEKFRFESQGDYEYQRPLEEAIERILRKKTAIDK